jgi:hypothetical protein
VKILYGGINPTLDNFNVQGVPATYSATHSFVWNYASYGMKIRNCKFRNAGVDYALYFSASDTDPLVLSNAIDIDHIDISNIGGIGIYFEGCSGASIRGQSVIEGCTGGGIKHGNEAFANQLNVTDTYFEGNPGFDISLGTSGGDYTVQGCVFNSQATPDHIIMSAATKLTCIGNTFYSGGVAGSAPISYVGIGNTYRAAVAGYTGTFDIEIKDTLRGAIKSLVLGATSRFVQTSITSGNNADIVSARPLSGTVVEEWRIIGSYNLAAGIHEIFRVFVSRQDTAIIGVIVTDFQEREVLTLDVPPGGTGWDIGDIITGVTSGQTAEIVSKTSTTVYGTKYRAGIFTLGEVLTNGTNTADQGAAFPTFTTVTGIPHSFVRVVDTTDEYDINVTNTGSITMYYWLTYVGNTRLFP